MDDVIEIITWDIELSSKGSVEHDRGWDDDVLVGTCSEQMSSWRSPSSKCKILLNSFSERIVIHIDDMSVSHILKKNVSVMRSSSERNVNEIVLQLQGLPWLSFWAHRGADPSKCPSSSDMKSLKVFLDVSWIRSSMCPCRMRTDRGSCRVTVIWREDEIDFSGTTTRTIVWICFFSFN